LPESSDSALLVGYNLADDAGVYRIGDEQALIQTVDFFTPIVDDPFTFGAIAAANALSDVYAMGGRPLTALNIVGFPHDQLEMEVLNQILLGGHSKVQEAGAVLVGGHTVRDPELKYGLSVTGVVHPDRVVTNAGARPGDRLILTKKLGTGLIANAFKADQIGEDDMVEAIASMTALNRIAAEQMGRFSVHACTDVTGFGLLGHAAEMAEASQVSLSFRAASVPMIDLALDLGAQPLGGGSRDNQLFLADVVGVDTDVPQARANVMFDAQTSGGLLIALPADQAEPLLTALRENGVCAAAIVGEVTAGTPGKIQVLS
jgi:selenide, water dikinase